MIEVRLQSVCKSYDGVTEAIPNLDLTCHRGEMLALLGPSGCGKSSTLKMVAGIEPVTRGAIYFDDEDVSRKDTASRNVAMVFEDYALYPHLSVFENIAFPLRIRGTLAAEVRTQVARILGLLGLEQMADDSVRQLSGGAQQRVSIGRALIRQPSLVMFDEPLSHLDADQKIQLRTEIKRLQTTSRLTSVLVTHDQTEAISMADRIAVMDKGVLQQVATPEEVYNTPANLFVAGFIGEPPMNILPAVVLRSDGEVRLRLGDAVVIELQGARGAALLQRHVEGESVFVGIRPEHISLQPQSERWATLEGTALVVEPGGDSDVLTATTPLGRVVAEVPGPAGLREGDALGLCLDVDSFHLFSADTGHNLAARLS